MRPGVSHLVTSTCLTAALLAPGIALANPEGGVVSGGQASITSSGNTLSVNQQSNRAVIDWRSFDIAPGETTEFIQPSASAIALNRVNSSSASHIDGNLTANGNIIIVNQNGVLFGSTAKVDVNGLVATTSDIDNNSFMSGGTLSFSRPGSSTGVVSNAGQIAAGQAGLVGFVAPEVMNSGTITAKLGRVQLASGDTFTVDMYGDGLMQVALSSAVTSQLVSNSGAIQADGGTIALTAAAGSNIVNSLITHTGTLQAQSVGSQDGSIVIASGSQKAYGGAGEVLVSGNVDASGYGGGETGGSITVTGDHVALLSGAQLDASGDAGGGYVKVGGDFHGGGTTPTAGATVVQSGAVINADAITSGDGGKVAVWADDYTDFAGSISARGGNTSGNGGFVETSGKQILEMSGTVDASAPHGNAGLWLLDPNNMLIDQSSCTGTSCSSASSISTSLSGGTSVTITTSDGSITLDTGVTITSTNSTADDTLTFSAGTDIVMNAGSAITASGTHKTNIVFDADTAAGGGGISISGNITSNGGNITMGGGSNPLTMAAVGDATYSVGISLNNSTIDARTSDHSAGGVLSLRGYGYQYSGPDHGSYDGVDLTGSTVETAGTGTISITGQGAYYGEAAHPTGTGVSLASSTITSDSGDISLAGYGGIDVSGNGGVGISLGTGNISSNAGNITVTGNGGASGGAADGTGVLAAGNISSTSGNITLTDTGVVSGGGVNPANNGLHIGLGGDFTVTSSGTVDFSSAVDGGGGYNLRATGGTVTFGEAVGSTTVLNSLTLTANSLSLGGKVYGTGTLTIAPYTASTNININNGASGLYLTGTEQGYIQGDWASAIIGNTSDTGTLSLGAATWASPVSFLTGSSGSISINGTQTTANQNITFNGPVTLGANDTVSAGSGAVTFDSTVNGPYALAISGGSIALDGSVTTAGAQTYIGALTLGGNDTFTTTNSSVTFGGTVDGAHTLSIAQGSGTVTFVGAVGGTTPLSTLDVSGSGTINLYGNITTSNADVTLTGPILLDGNSAISVGSGTLTFGSTVDSATYVAAINDVSVLAVAGGGGGGGGTGGGGGGGGVIYDSSYAVTGDTPVNVTVGAGGTGGSGIDSPGQSGGNSVFGSLTAVGGGGGGSNSFGTPFNGLSGGGGGGGVFNSSGGSGTAGQGHSGGSGTGGAPNYGAGGGGGAGGAGTNGTTTTGGAGGAGVTNSITGSSGTYGGGGGGGTDAGGTAGAGGSGGGGAATVAGTNGLGGGGGGATNNTGNSGAGGRGVVIVSYTGTASQALAAGGTSTTSGGNTIWTFTSGGSFLALSSGCSGGCNLTVNSGSVHFAGAVGGTTALSSLTATGATTLDANVTTTGAQTYNSAVTLSGNDTLTTTNSNVIFGSTVDGANALTVAAGTGTTSFTGAIGSSTPLTNLTVTSDNLTFGGNLSGTGTLTIAPSTVSIAVNINNGTTGLYLSSTEQGNIQSDWSGIIIGNTNDTGALTLGANTWASPVRFLANSSGAISLIGTQTGTGSATLSFTGPTTLSYAGTDATTANQPIIFNSAVTVGANATIDAGSGTTTFGSTVNGNNTLAVNDSGGSVVFDAVVGGSTSLSSLATTGATVMDGNVTTTGTQNYGGAVTLGGDDTLTTGNSSVTFGGTVNGAHVLTVAAGSGTITYTGAVGGSAALTSLNESGNGTTVLDGSVTTTGSQNYGGAVTLGGDDTLTTTNSNVTFGATVNGAHALTVAAGSGTITYTGAVGGSPALASLNDSGSGATVLDGNVTTTGSQNYGGAVTLGGDDTLTTTNSNVTFGSTVNGAHSLTVSDGTGTAAFTGAVGGGAALVNLTISSDNLTFGGNVSGTGTLTIAPATPGQAVNLNNGATGLYLSTAEIGDIQGGWGGITIGSTADTATLTAGAATWAAPLSLLNGSGDIAINGTQTMGGNTFFANTQLGNLTLGAGAGVTSSAAGNAIVVATGGNFVNNSGSGTPFTASSGRFIGYSTKKANDTNPVTDQQEIVGFNYTTLPPSNIVPGNGYSGTQNTWVYDTNSGSITLTMLDQNVVYGTAPNLSSVLGTTYSFSCSDGCSSSVLTTGPSLALSGGTGTSGSGNYNVGSWTIGGSGAVDSNGYTINYLTGTLTITRKNLDVTSLTGTVSKAYDGANTATLSAANYTTDAISGDHVSVSNTAGTYDTPDVGTGKTVTVNVLAITGADTGDYNLVTNNISGAVGTITKAALTITANNQTIVYGTSLGNSAFSAMGLQNGETVGSVTLASNDATLSGSGHYNVGSWTITPSGAAGGTFSAANYAITYDTGALTITRKNLDVTGLTGTVSKVYDATTAATLAAANYTTDAIGGDNVSVSTTAGTYDTVNVGTGKTVTVNGLGLAGADAGDYNLLTNNISGAVGTITKATLTITAQTNSKTYDATTTAAASPMVAGLQGADTVTGLAEAYANANAGTGKTLSVSGYTVNDGNAGGNYTVNLVSDTTGAITPEALTITATTNSKTYDGTTTAAATPTITAGSLQGADTAGFLEAYGSRNAGTGLTLIPSGAASDGNGGSNYTYTFVNDTTGVITPATLTVTAGSESKTYGAADPALGYIYAGLQTGDTASVFSGLLTRDPGESVGTYNISQGTLSAGANYSISFTGAFFSIDPASTPIISSVTLPNSVTGQSQGQIDIPQPCEKSIDGHVSRNCGSGEMTQER